MSNKSSLFLRLARPYVARRLRRQFFDVRLSGLEGLQQLVDRGPMILACNHVAWWDPLLLVHLDRILGSDGYCLMDQENLEKLPFFRWVGAIPIDRRSKHAAYRDVIAAGQLLNAPRRILAIFPQGEQRPFHLPLQFKSGIAALAAQTGAPVVPLAVRYDFLDAPRQVVHLKASDPLRFSRGVDTRARFISELEDRIRASLADVDQQLLDPKDDFVSLLHKGPIDSNRERIPRQAAALRALTRGDAHE